MRLQEHGETFDYIVNHQNELHNNDEIVDD